MLIRKLTDCTEIIAADGTRLRELLHPARDYPFGGRYSLAHAVLGPGESSRAHRLRSDEVYYILSGEGEIHIDEDVSAVSAGDAIDIPSGSDQWIANVGDGELVFLCIVDPAWQASDEEVL
ncbi:MAG: cupin domain-containing protein [Candidatus Zixiibacteriota bacterium]